MANLANSDGSDCEQRMPTAAETAAGVWLTTADLDFATVWRAVSPDWR